MQMLKAKLYLLKEQENAEKAAGIRGEVTEIGWVTRSDPMSCSHIRWLKTTVQVWKPEMWTA